MRYDARQRGSIALPIEQVLLVRAIALPFRTIGLIELLLAARVARGGPLRVVGDALVQLLLHLALLQLVAHLLL
ncbi:MAG: hypothetical protein ABUL45_07195, partial [Rhodanobacter sp.]